MPIIINPQNCRYTACTTLARTFSYNGLKPHLTGPVTAELKDLKTLLKTPTRVNDIVEVRLYIGPFQSLMIRQSIALSGKLKTAPCRPFTENSNLSIR